MDAILLALGSAALFGSMAVAIRLGFRSGANAETASLATLGTALVLIAAYAIARGQWDLPRAWPFLVAGVLAPGCSQVLFTAGVQAAGSSRASVTVGTAPLFSVAIALLFLGEPVVAGVIAGAVLVVAGGAVLASERTRPDGFRAIGLALAAGATVLFATRDSLIRQLGTHAAHVSPELAAFATILSGTLAVLLVFAIRRRPVALRSAAAFVPAGVLSGLSYLLLFSAFYCGRVSVVSPLIATETLWGVGLSALLIRQELVGRRLAFGAVLVVAGGVLIGIFR